jgi:hypothetical protein
MCYSEVAFGEVCGICLLRCISFDDKRHTRIGAFLTGANSKYVDNRVLEPSGS